MKTETYILPAYWACPLLYGDYSGLSDGEEIEIANWLENVPNGQCLSVDGDAYFTRRNDATNLGGDCMVFTFGAA